MKVITVGSVCNSISGDEFVPIVSVINVLQKRVLIRPPHASCLILNLEQLVKVYIRSWNIITGFPIIYIFPRYGILLFYTYFKQVVE
ncbi:hypothetical protein DDW01_00190 [Sulfolobus sp. SCGC AB-777_G05]|nr:hypothetical protein DDW01_00190 [Sulfolobus sp. SCGC AB-777_G05]